MRHHALLANFRVMIQGNNIYIIFKEQYLLSYLG